MSTILTIILTLSGIAAILRYLGFIKQRETDAKILDLTTRINEKRKQLEEKESTAKEALDDYEKAKKEYDSTHPTGGDDSAS